MIRPASQAELADLRQLRLKKFRKEENLLVAEGHHLVGELAGKVSLIRKVFILHEHIESLPDYLASVNPEIIRSISSQQLQKISDTETPQPVLAIARNPWQSFSLPADFKRALYLLTIQDPGNLGTIIRTAAWFGWDAVITSPESADWTSTKVLRSSAGAFLHIPVLEDDPDYSILKFLAERSTLFCLDLNGKSIHDPISIQGSLSLVIGNEARGFSTPESTRLPSSINSVHIPGFNQAVESLNAGIATGIALFRFSNG